MTEEMAPRERKRIRGLNLGRVSDDMLVEGFFTAVDAEEEHFMYVGWFV